MEYLTEKVELRERQYDAGKTSYSPAKDLSRDLSSTGLQQKVRYELSTAEKSRLVGKLQCDSTECWAGACQ